MSINVVFAKTKILSELSFLMTKYDEVYNSSSKKDIQLMKAYSKMALMTVTGWIEDGVKDLIEVSEIKLSQARNKAKIKELVNNINGFSYDKHISKALILGYGIHGYEFVNMFVGDSDVQILSSTLGNFKNWRDKLVHSHRAIIPCNPMMMMTEFKKIFPILKKFETGLKKYRDTHFKI